MKNLFLVIISITNLFVVCSDMDDLIRLICLFLYIVIFSYILVHGDYINRVLNKISKK